MRSIEIGTQRLYWKKSTIPWVQPKIYDNGSAGGNRMAVWRWSEDGGLQGGEAYVAFNGGGDWTGCYRDERWSAFNLGIYVPQPIIATGYQFHQTGGWGSEDGAVASSQFYGSNDGSNWIQLAGNGALGNGWGTYYFSNSTPYKYFRLRTPTYGGARRDYIKLSHVTIFANQEVINKGTASDYTYYEDVPAYYERFANDKYYGLG